MFDTAKEYWIFIEKWEHFDKYDGELSVRAAKINISFFFVNVNRNVWKYIMVMLFSANETMSAIIDDNKTDMQLNESSLHNLRFSAALPQFFITNV